jgi:hypothetical protein
LFPSAVEEREKKTKLEGRSFSSTFFRHPKKKESKVKESVDHFRDAMKVASGLFFNWLLTI